ncbi:unnamed protein product [Rangifer tarandus platyrhynchus]|uniref:Uncharacterized protein n=2 Tax=Rangifer tarandus platyrhynchus TaxID=3082113 RepID=A0ABN9A626_RANTA|nr:unnamed protein product [Rangifer tarandus platyrhynchus]CAI9714259.1 unnamed protein product [Rangifer tarandus platyrhynchus]
MAATSRVLGEFPPVIVVLHGGARARMLALPVKWRGFPKKGPRRGQGCVGLSLRLSPLRAFFLNIDSVLRRFSQPNFLPSDWYLDAKLWPRTQSMLLLHKEVPRRIQEGTPILFIERLRQAQDWARNASTPATRAGTHPPEEPTAGQQGTDRTAPPAPASPLPALTSPDPTGAAGAKIRRARGALTCTRRTGARGAARVSHGPAPTRRGRADVSRFPEG